jgi:hypothetical protein
LQNLALGQATLHTGHRICSREDWQRHRQSKATQAAFRTRCRTSSGRDFHAGNEDNSCVWLQSVNGVTYRPGTDRKIVAPRVFASRIDLGLTIILRVAGYQITSYYLNGIPALRITGFLSDSIFNEVTILRILSKDEEDEFYKEAKGYENNSYL